ncbi:MAG: hypothetical protein HJJLKODD_01629 [Phycisphaerae bacterium]|nr:hypothetical protein [Phycisphaerae bacterium]
MPRLTDTGDQLMFTSWQARCLLGFMIVSRMVTAPVWSQVNSPGDLCADPEYTCAQLDYSTCSADCPWPEPEDFVPDRRPIGVVGFYGGLFTSNPRGVDPRWYFYADVNPPNGLPDGVDFVMGGLNNLYNKGFRRIEINLPAGNTQYQNYSASQFWTLQEWQRDVFRDYVAPWRLAKNQADPDHPVTLSIYIGFKQNDPCRLCYGGEVSNPTHPECIGTEPSHNPDPADPVDMCIFAQNIQPWLDLGFTEVGLDFAEPNNIFPLSQLPEYQHVKFIAEPLPVYYWGEHEGEVHQDKIGRLGYFCTLGWIDEFRPFFKTYVADPNHTEMAFLLHPHQGSYVINQATVNDFVRRNWVGKAGRSDWLEMLRVAYGRGWFADVTLSCPADLDGDGDADCIDLDLLLDNFGATGEYLTRVHGDLDGDFDIDNDDLTVFLQNFGCGTGDQTDCNQNLQPDVCEADRDGDAAIDDCDICPDQPGDTTLPCGDTGGSSGNGGSGSGGSGSGGSGSGNNGTDGNSNDNTDNENDQDNANGNDNNSIADTGGSNTGMDSDRDGWLDNLDNCPLQANPTQADFDQDELGDVCDRDDDNDGVLDRRDRCRFSPESELVGRDGCPQMEAPSDSSDSSTSDEGTDIPIVQENTDPAIAPAGADDPPAEDADTSAAENESSDDVGTSPPPVSSVCGAAGFSQWLLFFAAWPMWWRAGRKRRRSE